MDNFYNNSIFVSRHSNLKAKPVAGIGITKYSILFADHAIFVWNI